MVEERVRIRSWRFVALIVAGMTALGGLFVIMPGPAAGAKSKPSPAPINTGSKLKQVEVVGPVDINEVPPTTPLELQGTFSTGTAATDEGETYNLLSGVSSAAAVSISSITATCNVCDGFIFNPTEGTYAPTVLVTVFSGNTSNCTTAPITGTIAQITVNGGEPSVDFTYPSPRTAPIGFTPSGPWCLGVTVTNGSFSTSSTVFVSVNGSQ